MANAALAVITTPTLLVQSRGAQLSALRSITPPLLVVNSDAKSVTWTMSVMSSHSSAASDAADNCERSSENFRFTTTQVSIHEISTSMRSRGGTNAKLSKTQAHLTNIGKAKRADIVTTV